METKKELRKGPVWWSNLAGEEASRRSVFKFFVYLLMHVYLYTRFQKSQACEVLNFTEIHCQIYKKTFPFVSNPNPLQGVVKSNI